MNKAILIGRLGKDPVVRKAGDKNVANFSLATDERGQTTWHQVQVWDKLADFANKYLQKGRLVCIEGRINYRTYEKDGQTRYVTEVVGYRLDALDSGNQDNANAGSDIPL